MLVHYDGRDEIDASDATPVALQTSGVCIGVTIWLRVFRTIGESHENCLIDGFLRTGYHDGRQNVSR